MSATVTETHEFGVEGQPRLDVHNRAGNLTISKGAPGQVRVVVTKRSRGLLGNASESDLEKLRVEVTQSGNTIRIDGDHGVDWTLFKQVTVDLDITVPESVDLDLRLNAGNTRVSDVTTGLRAEVNAGNLDLQDVMVAGSSRLTVNAGNLTMHGSMVEGASLDATVNAGNARFTFPRDAGIAVEARTTAGSIHSSVSQLQPNRHFASSSASGMIGASRGSRLRARVDAGSISLDVA